MVQGWLCSHLWEHYQFTQDETFLKNEAYPLMKGAAEFFADWLIDDGNGHLVTPVGVSPENRFITEDGPNGSHEYGTDHGHGHYPGNFYPHDRRFGNVQSG